MLQKTTLDKIRTAIRIWWDREPIAGKQLVADKLSDEYIGEGVRLTGALHFMIDESPYYIVECPDTGEYIQFGEYGIYGYQIGDYFETERIPEFRLEHTAPTARSETIGSLFKELVLNVHCQQEYDLWYEFFDADGNPKGTFNEIAAEQLRNSFPAGIATIPELLMRGIPPIPKEFLRGGGSDA